MINNFINNHKNKILIMSFLKPKTINYNQINQIKAQNKNTIYSKN